MFVFYLFLLTQLCLSFSLTPCNQDQQQQTYSDLLSKSKSIGSVYGFCEGLFDNVDLIYPLQELSCDGESGNDFTVMKSVVGYVGKTCRNSYAKLMCFLSFPKVRDNDSASIALPCTNEQADVNNSSPLSLSSWFFKVCPDLSRLNFTFTNLSTILTTVDNSLSTTSSRSSCRVVDNGKNEKVEDKNTNWSPELWQCPPPMLKKPSSILSTEARGCDITCPSPMFVRHQWLTMQQWMNVVNSISVVGSLSCIIYWRTIPEKRKFPAVMVFHILVCFFFVNVSIMMGSFRGIENDGFGGWCNSGSGVSFYNEIPCAIQGMLMMYFLKAGLIWWLFVVLNLYLVLVHDNRSTKNLKKYYYILAYGYPLIFIIFVASLTPARPSVTLLWCFFTLDGVSVHFFDDMVILMAFGAYVSYLIFRFLYKTQKKLSIKMARARTFSIKILITLSLLVLLSFLFAVQQDIFSKTSRIDLFVETWTKCVFNRYLMNNNTVDCQKEDITSYSQSVAFTVLFSSIGIYTTLLFGFNQDFLASWKQKTMTFLGALIPLDSVTKSPRSKARAKARMRALKRATRTASMKPDFQLSRTNAESQNALWGSKPRTRSTRSYDYILFGGGTGCGYAAKELVRLGIQPGQVAIITRESVPSYERYALSKGFLYGTTKLPDFYTCSAENGVIQDTAWYVKHGIELFLQTEISKVDLTSRTLESSYGQIFEATKGLVLATGSQCRKLPVRDISKNKTFQELINNYKSHSDYNLNNDNTSTSINKKSSFNKNNNNNNNSNSREIESSISRQNTRDEISEEYFCSDVENTNIVYTCEGLHYLRSYQDAINLSDDMSKLLTSPKKKKCIIIGGGYIALECSAALASCGLDVTIVMKGDRLVKNVFTAEVSAMYEKYFSDRRVKILKNSVGEEILCSNGAVVGCKLNQPKNQILFAELIIVGIGSIPSTNLFLDQLITKTTVSGHAIAVDGSLQTSVQGVYAIGDIAALPFRMYDVGQLEHALHARRSGEHVARVLFGYQSVYDYHPCIFAEPFDLYWKMWGDNGTPNCITVGTMETKLLTLWLWEGRIQGAFLQKGTAEDEKKLEKATKDQTKMVLKQLKGLQTADEILSLI